MCHPPGRSPTLLKGIHSIPPTFVSSALVQSWHIFVASLIEQMSTLSDHHRLIPGQVFLWVACFSPFPILPCCHLKRPIPSGRLSASPFSRVQLTPPLFDSSSLPLLFPTTASDETHRQVRSYLHSLSPGWSPDCEQLEDRPPSTVGLSRASTQQAAVKIHSTC